MPSSFQSAVPPCVLLGALLLGGCSRDEPAPPAADAVTVRELTAEEARTALLELAKTAKDDWLGSLATDLANDRIERENGYRIRIGRWECDLSEKWFNATLVFPKAHFHHHNTWSGVIERSPRGKWVARVTEETSAHGSPPDE